MSKIFFLLALIAFVLAIFDVSIAHLLEWGLAFLTVGLLVEGPFPVFIKQA